MKFYGYVFTLLILSTAALVAAQDQDNERERKEVMEFHRYGDAGSKRFQEHIAALKDYTRSDVPDPDKPVSQLNEKSQREYKPLNPITIFSW
jgi:hypothetical protein